MKGAILFTDVKSSSKLWARHKDSMLSALTAHERIVRKCVKAFCGFLVKSIGDAFMIKFKSMEPAILCAIAIQKLLQKHPVQFKGSTDKIELRIGIAYGDLESKTSIIQNHKLKDFYGLTVNLASRMESKVSPVNGLAFAANGVSSTLLKKISQHCHIKEVKFTYHCDHSISPVRSERLIQCRQVDELHLDKKERVVYSCLLI